MWCATCNAWLGQLGLEPTPELYVDHLLEVFREVWRVLRPDGSLWLNLGDCYAGSTHNTPRPQTRVSGIVAKRGAVDRLPERPRVVPGLKPKDLIGLPWLVALALRQQGWFLRSDIVWSKPNVMPESVRDRPTRSHEYLFLLAKSRRYFFDTVAFREPCSTATKCPRRRATGSKTLASAAQWRVRGNGWADDRKPYRPALRNRRTVWTVPTRSFRGAHFAVFPEALVEPCIAAATSEYGACAACGAPWARVLAGRTSDAFNVRLRDDRAGRTRFKSAFTRRVDDQAASYDERAYAGAGRNYEWHATCNCGVDRVPCVVLDPFAGAGTTGLSALAARRSFVGVEIKPEYVNLASAQLLTRLDICSAAPNEC